MMQLKCNKSSIITEKISTLAYTAALSLGEKIEGNRLD